MKAGDRVRETSTTTGTGTLNLLGATRACQGFVAGIGDGNECYYAIFHQTANEWEVGIGTVTDASPDTLSRDTVLDSSNSGSLVNFSAGTKVVIATMPADQLQKDYAGIYIEDNSTATTISAQNTWYQVVIFGSDMPEENADGDHTNDHIQVKADGIYRVTWNASFSGGGGDEYELALFKNNGTTQLAGTKVSRKLGTGGDVGACGATAIVALDLNDTIELWIRDTETVVDNATVTDAAITVERIA